MKCPCGCGEEVPNGCFWAKKKVCSKRGIKQGIHMPQNGTWREADRLRRKVKQAKKH